MKTLRTDDRPSCEVTLTEAAKERILDLRETPHKPAMIRLYVQGGGCSGFEYRIDMAKETGEDDIVIAVSPYITLFVDPFSAPDLEGISVDYKNQLTGGQFVFNNPQATSTCSCGASFTVD